MSAIITNQFRKNSRELFINDIDTNTNYFIGIGKSEPWPDDGGVEESDLITQFLFRAIQSLRRLTRLRI